MRVYFDASVIISALLSSTGGSRELINLVNRDVIRGITSQTVIEEILEEDKPTKLGKAREDIKEFIFKSGLVVRKNVTIQEIEPYQDLIDVEDAHLIAGAKLTRCDYLVTLDKKHILRADVKKKFMPLQIVSPKELLEEIVRTN